MVLSREDQRYRKEQILAMAVKQYIETVTPVSSGYISRECPLDLSSATVRNILAELEQDGLLTHPHTSAGRIPTERGYRYYVDNLMQEIQFLEGQKKRLQTDYLRQCSELEVLLHNTARAISDTTQYTSIISVDGWDNKWILTGTSHVARYPDNQDVQKIHDILAALDEKEKFMEVLNRELASRIDILIGHEIAMTEMEDCSLVISQYKTKGGPSGRMAVLGPTRMHYDRVVSALDYFQKFMEDIDL